MLAAMPSAFIGNGFTPPPTPPLVIRRDVSPSPAYRPRIAPVLGDGGGTVAALKSHLRAKVPARLLTELQEVQDISSMEGRLLMGITDLFEELGTEERQRRTAWEETAQRGARELRAEVEADLARGACESRRLLADARRDAAEARRMAQPCHDLLMALERHEAPAGLSEVIAREVKFKVGQEAERMSQTLWLKLEERLMQAVSGERSRWAEVCASQLSEKLSQEHELQENWRINVEGRLAETEARTAVYKEDLWMATEKARSEMEARINVSLDQARSLTESRVLSAQDKARSEMEARIFNSAEKTRAESESRMGSRLRELHEAGSKTQHVIEKFAERWGSAWSEEAQHREAGDTEARRQLEALSQGIQTQLRLFDGQVRRLETEVLRSTGTVENHSKELRAETELEVKTRQEANSQLLSRINEAQNALRNEMRMEAESRGNGDTRLSASLDKLRGLVGKLVSLVEIQSRVGGSLATGPGLEDLQEAAKEVMAYSFADGAGTPPLVVGGASPGMRLSFDAARIGSRPPVPTQGPAVARIGSAPPATAYAPVGLAPQFEVVRMATTPPPVSRMMLGNSTPPLGSQAGLVGPSPGSLVINSN